MTITREELLRRGYRPEQEVLDELRESGFEYDSWWFLHWNAKLPGIFVYIAPWGKMFSDVDPRTTPEWECADSLRIDVLDAEHEKIKEDYSIKYKITPDKLLERGYSIRLHSSKQGTSYYKALSNEDSEELVVDIFDNGDVFCRVDLLCDTFTVQKKLFIKELDTLYYLLSGKDKP